MLFHRLVAVAVATAFLPTACCAGAVAAEIRATEHQALSPFKLYAYGPGIGGLEVFFDNSAAHLADFANASAPQPNRAAVRVNFTATPLGIWTATPDHAHPSTISPTPFQNATFYVPTPSNASWTCGFAPDGALPAETTATRWRFYGNLAVTHDSLQGVFAAAPVAGEPVGVYALLWNTTGPGVVPVALKSVAPATRHYGGE